VGFYNQTVAPGATKPLHGPDDMRPLVQQRVYLKSPHTLTDPTASKQTVRKFEGSRSNGKTNWWV